MSHSESIERTVERFLVHKRALGRKYLSEQAELRLLVAFAQDEGVVSRPRCWMTSWGPGNVPDHAASTISSASSRVCSTGLSPMSCS